MHDLPEGIQVLFVAGFGPVTTAQAASVRLYKDVLSLPLRQEGGQEGGQGGYWYSQGMEGVKHFALWPLEAAALSCFGEPCWPRHLPTPQAWLEFDVADIAAATDILERSEYVLLTRMRKEPWGQTVTRFLSPEGILLAITHTPFLRGPA